MANSPVGSRHLAAFAAGGVGAFITTILSVHLTVLGGWPRDRLRARWKVRSG